MGLLRKLYKHRRGVSALEFALIAPVMVLIYFGCIELSMMMMADRRVTAAANTLGDLVARDTVITNSDLSDIFAATDFIFQGEGENAALRISSLYEDGGKAKVRWSDARGTEFPPYAQDAIIEVPAGVLTSGGSVIVAEIRYTHTSNIGYVISTEKMLGDTFYLKPRRGAEVTRDRS